MILKALSILVIAAALEVGGDALIRIGLEGATYYLAAGALTLFTHGFVVNKSGLDFNRLMGFISRSSSLYRRSFPFVSSGRFQMIESFWAADL